MIRKPICMLVAALFSTTVLANSPINPADFDYDKSGILTANEIEDFKQDLISRNTERARDWLDALKAVEDRFIPELHVSIPNLRNSVRLECNKLEKQLFIRQSFSNLPILRCPEVTAGTNGAQVSFRGDLENDTNILNIEGLIAYPIITPKNPPRDDADVQSLAPLLSDSALLAFAQANGTLNFGAANDGFSRFGISQYLRYENLYSDRDTFNFSTYFHSDLELEAEGYGAFLTYTPVVATPEGSLDINLPPNTAGGTENHLYLSTHATIDWLSLNDSGNTNFNDNSEFVWLGGEAELIYTDKNKMFPNGYSARAGVEYFYDINNNQEALQFTAGLDFRLDRAGKSSIGVAYTHGELRQDIEFEDTIEVNLKFKQ